MHGSTGGDWKRADNTAPRQSPTLRAGESSVVFLGPAGLSGVSGRVQA